MFTVAQIHLAHDQVKSGADFPAYIQTIKRLGVKRFVTYVKDSHTEYFGEGAYQTASAPMYTPLAIADKTDKAYFTQCLKAHQQGQTDYTQFCEDCAATGVEKWIVDLAAMNCIYYDKAGQQVLVEQIPE